MSTQPIPDRSDAELLEIVREDEATQRDVEVHKLKTIVAWAGRHTVTSVEAGAATICDGRVDTGVPIAGDGAPLVSEFALMELCASLGRSTAAGREYVGKVLEVAFRLPGIWDGVCEGRIEPWRALLIADKTRLLPADAAEYVDHHLASFVGSCSWAQIDRLVEEALVRFDPAAAEERRRDAAEQRRFDVDTEQVSFDGTVHVEGELDLADGLDLNDAIAHRAQQLADLGSEESLDVRRARAAGELARHDQTLDYEPGDGSVVEVRRPPRPEPRNHRPGRKVDLHVHLTDAAIKGAGGVARVGNTQSPISPEQVKEWCGTPGTTVIVRPVIDLAGHDPVGSYEIPDRHRRQVTLRDPHCAFPYCTQPASRCDLDHAKPYDAGGPTCPCNLVPLCRRHHRAKTHGNWSYVIFDPGSYLWTSPSGYQYLVDHRGTRDLTHNRWLRCEEPRRRASKPGGLRCEEPRRRASKPPDE